MHEHKNLMTALLKAKATMSPLAKDAKNPHFKSTYASLAAVVDVLRHPLASAGIVYIESPVPELEPGRIAIDLTICHAESGESITYRSPVMVAQQQTPQAIGSALTYARRYHLMTVFGLAPEDDDGNEGAKVQQPQRQAQQPTTNGNTNGNARSRNPAEDMPEVMTPAELPMYRAEVGLPTDAPEPEPLASKAQLVKINALGTQLYSKEWNDDKRHDLVAWKTKERTRSSKELTESEADSLIAALQRKIVEAAAAVQSAPQDESVDEPFAEAEPVTA